MSSRKWCDIALCQAKGNTAFSFQVVTATTFDSARCGKSGDGHQSVTGRLCRTVRSQDRLYFCSTVRGTRQIAEIRPTATVAVFRTVRSQDRLYFCSTVRGTSQIAKIRPTATVAVSRTVRSQDRLYFCCTVRGARQIAEIRPTATVAVSRTVRSQDGLYFFAACISEEIPTPGLFCMRAYKEFLTSAISALATSCPALKSSNLELLKRHPQIAQIERFELRGGPFSNSAMSRQNVKAGWHQDSAS